MTHRKMTHRKMTHRKMRDPKILQERLEMITSTTLIIHLSINFKKTMLVNSFWLAIRKSKDISFETFF